MHVLCPDKQSIYGANNVNKDAERHVIHRPQAALKITWAKLGHDSITYKHLEAKGTWTHGFHTLKHAASHLIIQDFQMNDVKQLQYRFQL